MEGSWPVHTPTEKVITGSQTLSLRPRHNMTIENTSSARVNTATITNTHSRRSIFLPEAVRITLGFVALELVVSALSGEGGASLGNGPTPISMSCGSIICTRVYCSNRH